MFSLLTCLNLIHCCLGEAKEINIVLIHAGPNLKHLLPWFFGWFFFPINLAGNIRIPKMLKSEHECVIFLFKPAFARLRSRTRCTLCPVKMISHLLISLLVKIFHHSCNKTRAPFLYSPHTRTVLHGRSSSACK